MPFYRRRGYGARRTTRFKRRGYGSRYKRRGYAKKSQKLTKWKMPRYGRGLIIPDTVMTKMTAFATLPFVMTSGADQTLNITGNDLTDPFASAGGSTVTGYTEYGAFYQRWAIYASKISILATSAGTTNATSQIDWVIVPCVNIPSSAQDPDQLARLPYAKIRTLNGPNVNPPPTMTHYMSTSKIHGLNKTIVGNDDTFWGLYPSTAPAKLWYWHIVTRPVDDNATCTIRLRIKLTYYVKWFQRASLAPS